MNSAEDLLKQLRTLNIKLSISGEGGLVVNAPKGAITSELKTRLVGLKPALIAELKKRQELASNSIRIERSEKKVSYPLSSQQSGIYVTQELNPDSVAYNITTCFEIEGEIDFNKIENAIGTVISSQSALRTSFEVQDGVVVQLVHDRIDFKLNHRFDSESDIAEIIEDFQKPFDLTKAPLLRGVLIMRSDKRHFLICDAHHVVFDGLSVALLIDGLAKAYADFPLNNPQIEYTDFSEWQISNQGERVMGEQEQYWLNIHKDAPEALNLPLDRHRPAIPSFRGSQHRFRLDANLTKELSDICLARKGTLFMGCLAIYNTVLAMYSRQNDIIVGCPLGGRLTADSESVIGMFSNVAALRLHSAWDVSFESLLSQTREATIGALNNNAYPFTRLVKALGLKVGASRNPLFDVMFEYQREAVSEEWTDIGPMKIRLVDTEMNMAQFDLVLHISEREDELACWFDYATDLFDESTVKRLADSFVGIAKQVVTDPTRILGDIDPLTPEDRVQLLTVFNDTEISYPIQKRIHELFEEQVENTPDAVAVIFADEILTYSELNRRANGLACYLVEDCGIKNENVVGIMTERSTDMIVGILGILKSGGAYLPLDPTYPSDRIEYMLEDAECKALVVDQDSGMLGSYNGMIIVISDALSCSSLSGGNYARPGLSSNLAYLIYTSGSTGKPKGVMIEHRSVLNFMKGMDDIIQLRPGQKIISATTICFDIFVLESLVPLMLGMTIVIASREEQLDSEKLNLLVANSRADFLQATPTLMRGVVEANDSKNLLSSLRAFLVGGEPFPESLKQQIQDVSSADIYNLYGPTETTVWSSVSKLDNDAINIGRPIANTRVYIADAEGRLLPIGAIGELCIAGDGLARGYLNRPELNSEKFVALPYEKNSKAYRTGDLARWLPSGELECLGRIDNQVKIRGFRIELGEIENVLLNTSEMHEVAVVAKTLKGEPTLVAYYNGEESIDVSKLRKSLQKSLPSYMVPSYFVFLERFPLTSNGKIDRKSLPDPSEGEYSGIEYVEPRNEGERILSDIWQNVLGVPKIGIDDDFFELGGHSLKAVNSVSKIKEAFEVDLSLMEAFKYTTIRVLSEKLASKNHLRVDGLVSVESRAHYPVSSQQKRIYALQQINASSVAYNMPGVYILSDRIDITKFQNAVDALIEKHDSLRTQFNFVGQELYQFIDNNITCNVDIQEIGDGDVEKLVAEFIRPFDLAMSPLLRIKALLLSGGKTLLMTDTHHIVSDGISNELLISDFAIAYSGATLEQLPFQYRDYAVWQQEGRGRDLLAKQREYWIKEYEGEIQLLNLPTDFERPRVRTFDGDSVSLILDEVTSLRLEEFCNKEGITVYMMLLAGLHVLISRYCGQYDVITGCPVSARDSEELDGIIGMFVNTLAIRSKPDGNKHLRDYIGEVKAACLGAFENQQFPFEDLIAELDLERDMSRNPLFDIALVLQNYEAAAQVKALGTVESYELQQNIAKFDLTLVADKLGNAFQLSFEYASRLFRRETVERLASHYIQLLRNMIDGVGEEISNIEMLSEVERSELLVSFNKTDVVYPEYHSIVDLFEEQVACFAKSTALVCGETEMTYEELNSRANFLARRIRSRHGVAEGSIVGVYSERSFDMIVAMLAVLKTGAAYLPLDPNYPEERINFILKDSGSLVLLIQKTLKGQVSFAGDTVDIEIDETEGNHSNSANLSRKNSSIALAYVIYTSGSTGKPKGVAVEHKGLVNLVFAQTESFQIDQFSKVYQGASFSFDASVSEIFTTICSGATLVLPNGNSFADIGYLQEKGVSVATITPSVLSALGENDLPTLKTIVSAGERCPLNLAQKWAKKARFINAYGPTENTVCSTLGVFEETDERVSIGKPISNHRAYVLGGFGELLPTGVVGELCVAGVGLAREYLNRELLTKERFVACPYLENARMYKTGDLASWLPDGNLDYVGRMDNQVKVRGFRIELGEVESALLSFEEVREAVVLAKVIAGEQSLVGYCVLNEGLDESKLLKRLASVLPHYMVPARLLVLKEFPHTANGKLDIKSLPEPESERSILPHVAPSNAREEALVGLWSEVLAKDPSTISVHDNFFDLGGNSLSSIRLAARAKDAGIPLQVMQLMESPTIAKLALLDFEEIAPFDDIEDVGEISLIPMQMMLLKGILPDRFVLSFRFNLHRRIAEQQLRESIKFLMEHHSVLRSVFTRDGNASKARIAAIDEFDLMDLVRALDLTGMSDDEQEKIIGKNWHDLRPTLNILKGENLRLVLYDRGKDIPQHMQLFVHHFVIDGERLGILLDDLALLFYQVIEGQELKLPRKTAGFREVANRFSTASISEELMNELPFWNKLSGIEFNKIPLDGVATYEENTHNTAIHAEYVLNEDATILLMNELPKLGASILDAIHLGFASSISEWTDSDWVIMRANNAAGMLTKYAGDLDATRTLGWFTTEMNVVLPKPTMAHPVDRLLEVKKFHDSVPSKGIGHTMLLFGSGKKEVEEVLEKTFNREIIFNYFGIVEKASKDDFFVEEIPILKGERLNAEEYDCNRDAVLFIQFTIVDNKLHIECEFGSKIHKRETIDRQFNIFMNELESLSNSFQLI